MGHHTLDKGKELIAAIVEIGKILGYVAKKEFPIDKKRTNPPAVDVAWLSDEDHDFPLMIFEVESKIGGAIANNPVKIFGSPNESFEKPLFFFHIFLTTPDTSTKVDNLKSLFGLYNYRTYDLSKESDHTRLVTDIISQHRRLYKKIDVGAIIKILKEPIWELIDLEILLIHIEEQRFSSNYLKTYSLSYFDDPVFKKHYLRYLKSYIETNPDKIILQDYGTYWGYQWADPIHYAILINTDPAKQKEYIEKFINWQEKSTYMSMIGPHLGLSRDYDEFIICLAPPFLSFLSVLLKHFQEGILYIADQLKIILEKLSSYAPRISFFSALWLLHIAAACLSERHFNFARAIINDNGGISEQFLYAPPNSIPLDSNDGIAEFKAWSEDLQKNPIEVPELKAFKDRINRMISENNLYNEDVFGFALDVLLDPGVNSNWAKKIMYLLAS
jgi:hypothetical protein